MQTWVLISVCAAPIFILLVIFIARAYANALVEKRITQYQTDNIARHLDEVRSIYRDIRGWRHDFHNHIQTMKACRALGQDDRLDAYLSGLDDDLARVDTLLRTGNVMVDAMLNSKLSLASSRGIRVNAKAVVPSNIAIAEIDLCIILGNLLDNAIEAAQAVPDDSSRILRIYIDVKRDQLYISITNASAARTKRVGTRFISTKGEHRGFGLSRIDRIVKKYQGYLKRRDEDGAFTTEILLPLT